MGMIYVMIVTKSSKREGVHAFDQNQTGARIAFSYIEGEIDSWRLKNQLQESFSSEQKRRALRHAKSLQELVLEWEAMRKELDSSMKISYHLVPIETMKENSVKNSILDV